MKKIYGLMLVIGLGSVGSVSALTHHVEVRNGTPYPLSWEFYDKLCLGRNCTSRGTLDPEKDGKATHVIVGKMGTADEARLTVRVKDWEHTVDLKGGSVKKYYKVRYHKDKAGKESFEFYSHGTIRAME